MDPYSQEFMRPRAISNVGFATAQYPSKEILRWVPRPKKRKRPVEEGAAEYEPNDSLALASEEKHASIVFFGIIPGDVQLRNRWYMRRRLRPMVPAPSDAPMPDKQKDKDKKARLFALYLRPWVLDSTHAQISPFVPHLGDLDLVCTTDARSYSQAWSWYVRGHIVSRHACRIIMQFMAACCGKSTTREAIELATVRESTDVPESSIALDRVRELLSSLAEKASNEEDAGKKANAADDDAAKEQSDDNAEIAHRKAIGRSQQIQNALTVTNERC